MFFHWPVSWSERCGSGQSHTQQQQHDDNLHTAVACVSDEDENSFVQIYNKTKQKDCGQNRFIQMCMHESKMMLTPKKIPNLCCGCWNKLERSCSLTKFGNACRLVLLYSVVVRCRGCVHILRHGVSDSLVPALINHLQQQVCFLSTGDASLA